MRQNKTKRNIRWLAALLSVCLLCCAFLSGCGGGSDTESDVPSGESSALSDDAASSLEELQPGEEVSGTEGENPEAPVEGTVTGENPEQPGGVTPVTPDTPASPQTQDPEQPGSSGSAIPYITSGLVARYDFEDGGNIGRDASGHNHPLYVWGMPPGLTATPCWPPGR